MSSFKSRDGPDTDQQKMGKNKLKKISAQADSGFIILRPKLDVFDFQIFNPRNVITDDFRTAEITGHFGWRGGGSGGFLRFQPTPTHFFLPANETTI